MRNYVLYETGPDNRSTYAECWGIASTSRGRERAAASRLADLVSAVDDVGHDNFWIRGPGGRNVAGSRREFRALPSVARRLAQLQRTEQ